MRYNTIEIKPISDKWKVLDYEDKQDRKRTATTPNAMGFYHYPRSMPREKAFKKLKTLLVKRHKKEIERLQKSLMSLEKVSIERK